jgi:transcriptional regulator with XRE-family HTH domain
MAAATALVVSEGTPQDSFAARADVDRSYYGATECGQFNLSVDTIAKIAKGPWG